MKIPHSQAMLLVGVLWVLPMLALALLFSEGDGLVETGCRFAPEQGHPGILTTVEFISSPVGYPVLILINHSAPTSNTPIRNPPKAIPRTPGRPLMHGWVGSSGHGWVNSKFLLAFPPYAHCSV